MPPQTQTRTIRVISQVEGAEDIKKLSDSMGKMNKQVKTLSDSVSFFGSVFTSVFAAQIFGTGIRDVLGMADSMQLLTDRIKTLIPATEDVGKVMQNLYETANNVRTPVNDLASTFARVAISTKDLGLQTDTMLLITENLQKTFTISGASIQEAQASTIQFTQGLAAGVLRGEEFNSVMEQNATLAKILAKEISGGSVAALRQMAREGKLVNTEVLSALIKNSTVLDEQFKVLRVTVSQASTVFTNNFTKAISGLSEDIGLTSGISKAILWLSNNLMYLAVGVVPILVAAIWGLVGALRAAAAAGTLFSRSNIIIAGLTIITGLVVAAIQNWEEWSLAIKSWGQYLMVQINKGILALHEFDLAFAKSMGLETDLHYIRVANAVENLNSAEKAYSLTMSERDKAAKESVAIQERQENAMKNLLSGQNKAQKVYKNTKEILAELNALYISGRINADKYFSRLGGTRLKMLNKDFADGKKDLLDYVKAQNELSRVDLNKLSTSGLMNQATFEYEQAALKMRDLNVELQAGKISLFEFNNEMVKLPGNTLSTLDAVNMGVISYYQGIETYSLQVMKATGTIFKSAEDELVNFAKTGEATWTKFTDVVIDQLLRIMVQLSIIKPLMDAVMGFNVSTGAAMGSSAASTTSYATPAFAKGGAFNSSGVTPFASGGVVSSPTMFGFGGNKMGVMGEAGPEAIMPLKRTASGDLGVQASTSPVYVNIINNASGTEVTQTETTGPNGERMLEVAVNNIVNRGLRNGTYDTTMQNSFNMRRKGK